MRDIFKSSWFTVEYLQVLAQLKYFSRQFSQWAEADWIVEFLSCSRPLKVGYFTTSDLITSNLITSKVIFSTFQLYSKQWFCWLFIEIKFPTFDLNKLSTTTRSFFERIDFENILFSCQGQQSVWNVVFQKNVNEQYFFNRWAIGCFQNRIVVY